MNRIGETLWRMASIEQFAPPCLESDSEWVGKRERVELACVQDRRRRLSGLAARLLAKRLYLQCSDQAISLGSLDILSRDDAGRHVRPRLFWAGKEIHCGISISHTEDLVLVALRPSPATALGVDLVRAEPLDGRLVRTWFSAGEQDSVRTGDPWEACRLWAIKEAVYKAVNRGEPFRPRQVVIRRLPSGDYVSNYGDGRLRQCGGIRWWQYDDHLVVLASDRWHDEQPAIQGHYLGVRPTHSII